MPNPNKNRADRNAGLERIKTLEWLLAASPVSSLRRRELRQAIRIEAAAYRKSLDAGQAARTFGARSARTASLFQERASTGRTTR